MMCHPSSSPTCSTCAHVIPVPAHRRADLPASVHQATRSAHNPESYRGVSTCHRRYAGQSRGRTCACRRGGGGGVPVRTSCQPQRPDQRSRSGGCRLACTKQQGQRTTQRVTGGSVHATGAMRGNQEDARVLAEGEGVPVRTSSGHMSEVGWLLC